MEVSEPKFLPKFLPKMGPSPPQQVLTPPATTTHKLRSIRITHWLANEVSNVSQQLVSHNEFHRNSQSMIVIMSQLNVMRMVDD